MTIDIDCTPQEFQELFIPTERQSEFLTATYDAYVTALNKMIKKQIDPYNFTGMNDETDRS